MIARICLLYLMMSFADSFLYCQTMKRIRGNNNVIQRKSIITLRSVTNDDAKSRSISVEEETWSWIKRVIIGMDFCPFAAKPWKENRLYVQVLPGDDPDEVLHAVQKEMMRLQRLRSSGSTTVIVTPDLYPLDFQQFYLFVQWLEEQLEDYEGEFQTIAFHPKFEFKGSGSEGFDNYTNRSPYPMIHILAEDDVSRAVDSYGGDTSRVWKRNVAFLELLHEQIGRENVDRFLLRGDPIVTDTLSDIDNHEENLINIRKLIK